jgi:transposase
MSLFDNLSSLDSDSELDLDLYELQLVLNGQSDSDSEPSEHEPLSEAEASNIGAIPPIRTDTEDSTASQHSKKPYFYTVSTRILALTQKRDGIPIHEITNELGISKSAINRL